MAGRYSRTLAQQVGTGESGAGWAQRALAWLPVAVWCSVVMTFSQGAFSAEWTAQGIGPLVKILGLTPEQALMVRFFIRKGAHAFEYGLLGLLVFRAFLISVPTLVPRRAALFALGFALVLASIDEWNQSTEPTRTGTPRDVALDLAGATAGVLGWSVRRAPLR
jgi:VanZ family protein